MRKVPESRPLPSTLCVLSNPLRSPARKGLCSLFVLGKFLFSVSPLSSKNNFFSYCKRSCRAGGVTHQVRAYGEPQNTPLQGVRIVLLIAVGYFEADRRSVPDAQRPGYCPLRSQSASPALTKRSAAGATVRESTGKSPPADHTLCSNEPFTLPRPKRSFFFVCFRKVLFIGLPTLPLK